VTGKGATGYRFHWRVILLGSSVILAVAIGTALLRFHLWAYVPYRGYGASSTIVEIPPGAGLKQTLAILEDHGVVRAFPLASAYLRLTGRARGIKAGEYNFTRPVTPAEAVDKIIRGDVYYHKVRVHEGARSDEIFETFERAGFGSREEFLEAFQDTGPLAGLDDEAVDLEGYLFPDTYSLPKETTAEAIISMMVARFKEIFGPEQIESAAALDMTVREVVTLGSLVERETSLAEENPKVASVFHNRLRRGMRLQCDPTIIYALAMRNQYDGNIRRRDLRIDSLYNTYRYGGLPPGPIGNPGSSALRAVLEPADTNYLYFVSKNTGRHYFSKTLEEHNRAVWEYQKKPYRLRRLARSKRSARGS
jgi:UPF0755 protein